MHGAPDGGAGGLEHQVLRQPTEREPADERVRRDRAEEKENAAVVLGIPCACERTAPLVQTVSV